MSLSPVCTQYHVWREAVRSQSYVLYLTRRIMYGSALYTLLILMYQILRQSTGIVSLYLLQGAGMAPRGKLQLLPSR